MPNMYLNDTSGMVDSRDINFMRSTNDSLLRQQVEAEEQFRLSVLDDNQVGTKLHDLHFFTPVHGLITGEFNPAENHFGVDLVAEPDEVVKATLDGTVTMSTWTLETGYVIQIQHDYEIISVYTMPVCLKQLGRKYLQVMQLPS